MILFLLGMFVGTIAGFMISALLSGAKREDEMRYGLYQHETPWKIGSYSFSSFTNNSKSLTI